MSLPSGAEAYLLIMGRRFQDRRDWLHGDLTLVRVTGSVVVYTGHTEHVAVRNERLWWDGGVVGV